MLTQLIEGTSQSFGFFRAFPRRACAARVYTFSSYETSNSSVQLSKLSNAPGLDRRRYTVKINIRKINEILAHARTVESGLFSSVHR